MEGEHPKDTRVVLSNARPFVYTAQEFDPVDASEYSPTFRRSLTWLPYSDPAVSMSDAVKNDLWKIMGYREEQGEWQKCRLVGQVIDWPVIFCILPFFYGTTKTTEWIGYSLG